MPGPQRVPFVLRFAAVAVSLFSAAAVLNVGYQALAQEGSQTNADIDLEDPELIEQGEQLFGRSCAVCHGEAGRGVSQEQAPQAYGPSLVDVGPASADFMLRTGRMPLENANDQLRHQPQKVSDAERRALVAYVASLGEGGGPEIPDVSGWPDADLSAGLELFTTNCAACHGPTAAGVAVGQRDVSSSLEGATPLEVAEAIRTGPGVMPVFGGEALPQDELESVIHWVMELRDRASPGGVHLGRSGPVWEGLVAWVLGMGALVVVMYLLGEKAEGDDDVEPNA